MGGWFEALSRRDQIALLVLGGALTLWLFIQLVVIELDGRRARLTRANQMLSEQLVRVDFKTEQLAGLRAGDGGRRVNLTQTLSQASDAHNLAVKRLQPNSRGEVQIRFEGVDFDGLLKFLEDIEGSSGLRVMDASVSSAGRDSGVNATLRVSGN
jgi:type II secretory pathway component PulM